MTTAEFEQAFADLLLAEADRLAAETELRDGDAPPADVQPSTAAREGQS